MGIFNLFKKEYNITNDNWEMYQSVDENEFLEDLTKAWINCMHQSIEFAQHSTDRKGITIKQFLSHFWISDTYFRINRSFLI